MSHIVRLEPFEKHPSESARVCADLRKFLTATETLSLASVVSVAPAGELTATDVDVNAGEFKDKSGAITVPIGKGITVFLEDGVSGTTYEVVLRAENSNGEELPAVTLPVMVTGTGP